MLLAVADREVDTSQWRAGFPDRQRLAGQRGLVDLEVDRLDHARVGRHAVAGFEQNDVARHQVAGRDVPLLAVAHAIAVGAAMRRSASMARSARYSWTNPSTTANEHDHRDDQSLRRRGPATRRAPTATSRITISTFLNCASRRFQGEMRRAGGRARSARARPGAGPRLRCSGRPRSYRAGREPPRPRACATRRLDPRLLERGSAASRRATVAPCPLRGSCLFPHPMAAAGAA